MHRRPMFDRCVVADRRAPKDFGSKVHARRSLEIVVKPDGGGADRHYPLQKFARSNQGTCLNHKVRVKAGQHVTRGDVLADGPAIEDGEMALGRNVLGRVHAVGGLQLRRRHPAFGAGRQGRHVHLDSHRGVRIGGRETKLGPEEINPRHPQRRRRRACVTSTSAASSTSAPRSSRATSWWARSRPRRDRALGRGAAAARDLR